jgi:hypothetical protein
MNGSDEIGREMNLALQVGADRTASGAWRLDEYSVRRDRTLDVVAVHMNVVVGDTRHAIDVLLPLSLHSIAWAEIVTVDLDEAYEKLMASVTDEERATMNAASNDSPEAPRG